MNHQIRTTLLGLLLLSALFAVNNSARAQDPTPALTLYFCNLPGSRWSR